MLPFLIIKFLIKAFILFKNKQHKLGFTIFLLTENSYNEGFLMLLLLLLT